LSLSDYFQNFNEKNPQTIQLIGLQHINLKRKCYQYATPEVANVDISEEEIKEYSGLADVEFVHLHNHSQFSVLQSTISITDLVLPQGQEMPAVALTDHANMMGAFHFVKR
jgi:DNA polymerase-3 subunit alpha